MFYRRLYFKKEIKAGEYSKHDAWKPIYSLPKERYEDSDCWSYGYQTSWGEPSLRQVSPKNCEQIELDKLCHNLVFCIPLTIGFLPGCGRKKIIDFPLSKAMGGCRNIVKVDMTIDKIAHPNASKAYKYKTIETRGILQHVIDTSE